MSKETSQKLASIAARGIRKPDSLTEKEIKSLSASVLAQKEKNNPDVLKMLGGLIEKGEK